MTVLYFEQKPDSTSKMQQLPNSSTVEVSEDWQAATDNPADTRWDVYNFAGQLGFYFGAPHPQAPFSVPLTDFDITEESQTSPRLWKCRLKWSGTLQPKNPLDVGLKLSGQTEVIDVATVLDAEGKVRRNTANVPLEPVTRKLPVQTFEFKLNRPTLPNWWLSYGACTNLDSLTLLGQQIEPGKLLLSERSFGQVTPDDDPQYVGLAWKLQYNPLGWDGVYPNVGLEQLVTIKPPEGQGAGDGAPAEPQKVLQKIVLGAQPVTTPQLLDNDGRWLLDPTRNPAAQLPQDIVFLKFREFPRRKFRGVIPLP
jgi:hypothetical protein